MASKPPEKPRGKGANSSAKKRVSEGYPQWLRAWVALEAIRKKAAEKGEDCEGVPSTSKHRGRAERS